MKIPALIKLCRKETSLAYRCKVTVVRKACFQDLQNILADPKRTGVCPHFECGEIFIFDEELEKQNGGDFCRGAWSAISRHVTEILHGTSEKEGKMRFVCCSDGTRPVVFRIERLN